MKTLNKSLAVILSFVLMLSAIPMISVGAQNVYKELSLDTKQNVRITDDLVMFSFTPEKDGFYEFVSTGDEDSYAVLYDSSFEVISECDDYFDCNFLILEYLHADECYYLEVGAYDSSKFDVYVTESVGVESAVVTCYPDDMTCIRGYEENSVNLDGLCVDFSLSDGSVVNWTYDDETYDIGKCPISFEMMEPDGDNVSFVITCGMAQIELVFTVVESPVDRIELNLSKPISYYENTNGMELETGGFYYYIDIPEGSVLDVYYKDGSKKQITDFGYYSDVEIDPNQINHLWTVGTNYFTVMYYGVSTQVPVEILSSPVKSVVVNSAPKREYYFKDEEWGYTNEIGRYIFTPSDIEGLSFTVEYVDGAVETFDDSDIDMENQTIGGYPYEVKESFVVKPMKTKATLTFRGFDFSYMVNVVESPVKNIEVLWGPENCFIEDRYLLKLDGTELRVTFTDGTEKIIVLDENNTHYYASQYLQGYVSDPDVEINFFQSYNGFGEPVLSFQAYDKWADFDGLYFEESREIKDIKVDNFTPDCDKMKAILTYADGGVETLVFDAIDVINVSYYNTTLIIADTENGLVYLEVKYETSDDGTGSYKLRFFDRVFEFEKVDYDNGDVDMDRTVSIMDATAIALHLAQIDKLSECRLELADTDEDGIVSIMDATQIQLDLVQI